MFGHPAYFDCNVALAFCPFCLKYTNILFKQLSLRLICHILSMPPRKKRRRLAEPTVSDASEVQFVPDPVEIQPQQAVAAFTGEDNRSDTLVSTIVAAVRTAIQSTSAVQPTNVVEAAVQDDVSQIASGSGGEVLLHSPLFHSIAVPLGSRISAKIKAKIWAEEFVDLGLYWILHPIPTNTHCLLRHLLAALLKRLSLLSNPFKTLKRCLPSMIGSRIPYFCCHILREISK